MLRRPPSATLTAPLWPYTPLFRLRGRDRRGREPRAAVGTQPPPHTAADVGHGRRAFRRRGVPGGDGRRKRLHQGTAGRGGAGRGDQDRRFFGEVRRGEDRCGAELYRDRGDAGSADIVGDRKGGG